jgi:hypothetical protein
MNTNLPTSVRYVKNGKRSQWWPSARANGQLQLGWAYIPPALLLNADFNQIGQLINAQFGDKPGATQDFNALRDLLDSPSRHLWVTFEDGFMWWCTVRDGVTINPYRKSNAEPHFWLMCESPWSKHSLNGRVLSMSDLPGTVTSTAGFRATVCKPRDWEAILRIIKDQTDPDATKSAECRRNYEIAVARVVQRLSPKDFEQLIDLILARTGWERISTVGGTREGIDIEAENPTVAEIAFVQVKSTANQQVLDDYVGRFNNRRDRYSRMIFAVHSPHGNLDAPSDMPVQIWTIGQVAELVVRLGLGKWVEDKLA